MLTAVTGVDKVWNMMGLDSGAVFGDYLRYIG